jgi:hypothetical protein
MPNDTLPDREKGLSAAARLQGIVPGTVLAGGTADLVWPDVLRADARTKLDGGPERSRPEQHGPRLVGSGHGERHDQ